MSSSHPRHPIYIYPVNNTLEVQSLAGFLSV